MQEEELTQIIEDMCASKAEEFRLLGYEHVTPELVWAFVSERYPNGDLPALHQLVNDILSLKIVQFMNWMTISAYKGKDVF